MPFRLLWTVICLYLFYTKEMCRLYFLIQYISRFQIHEVLIEEQGQSEAISIVVEAVTMVMLASFLSPKVSSRQIIMARRTAKVHQEMREVVAVALTIWRLQQISRPDTTCHRRDRPRPLAIAGLISLSLLLACLCTIPITLFTCQFVIATRQILNGGQRIKLQF